MLKVRFKLESTDSQLKETHSEDDTQNEAVKDQYKNMNFKQFGEKKDLSDLF